MTNAVYQLPSISSGGLGMLVLLVEDDPAVQFSLRYGLEQVGFTVAEASCGDEAIAILNRTDVEVRALVADIELGPGPTGWDVSKRARERYPYMPVIYISGSNADAWESDGMPNSMFILKPFTRARIVTAISRLIIPPSAGPNG
jgi:DNA-binding response OmpR family regulator